MRVLMKETRQAAPDGAVVVELTAGEEYDLPAALAERYFTRGFAVEVKADKTAGENKGGAKRPKQRRRPKADKTPGENKDAAEAGAEA